MLDWVRKITDIIMPLEPLPEEEDYVEEKKSASKSNEHIASEPIQNQNFEEMPAKKFAAGGGFVAPEMNFSTGGVMNSSEGSMSMGGMRYTAYSSAASPQMAKPSLAVVKSSELSVRIYAPTDFEQVTKIADDIINRCAAVVNYENVGDAEKRQICDFVNGVCYATDGMANMISEKIFLYVPNGVDASDISKITSAQRF